MIEKIKMMLMWKILAIPTAIHMRIDKIPVLHSQKSVDPPHIMATSDR